MDNQACRKRDLELWQVLEPTKTKTTQRRTNTQAKSTRTKQGGQNRSTSRQTRANVQIVTMAPSRDVQGRNRPRSNAAALKRRKARQRKLRIYRCCAVALLLTLCAVLFWTVSVLYQNMQGGMHIGKKSPEESDQAVFGESLMEDRANGKPEIQEDFLGISEYNRPGTKLSAVKNIFVHYTANPRTSAAQNRSYFEGLSITHERAASAHFIIGCEGEIIQCIPLDEEAYAVIGRNNDSLSIECCYRNEDGSFEQATYDSLIQMLAWLVEEYDLEAEDILRHYDSCEKLCPLYYVEHEDEWEKLIRDVKKYGKSVDTKTSV